MTFYKHVLFWVTCYGSLLYTQPDVTVIGPLIYADGLGRLAMGFIDCLKIDVSMSFRITYGAIQEMPIDIIKTIKKSTTRAGKVSILFDIPWASFGHGFKKVPKDSFIKLAYSMLESTAIPPQWVYLFNNKFDAVLVPDDFHVEVYKNCGVRVPIFVFPHGLYLEEFLNYPIKSIKNDIFTFGISAGLYADRKNPEILAQAFHKEFGEDSRFRLRIHIRGGRPELIARLTNTLQALNNKNIEFINKTLSKQQYLDFMASLDCYVLLSKGEGFSVTPREALALGVPCIITNNTAHTTICNTGFVRAVSATIKEPAIYEFLGGTQGYNFNCALEDVCVAMRDVYESYQLYLHKAHQGREWVKQYLYNNLKDKYLALVKPENVILSNINSITARNIATTSKTLYRKYQALIKSYKKNKS